MIWLTRIYENHFIYLFSRNSCFCSWNENFGILKPIVYTFEYHNRIINLIIRSTPEYEKYFLGLFYPRKPKKCIDGVKEHWDEWIKGRVVRWNTLFTSLKACFIKVSMCKTLNLFIVHPLVEIKCQSRKIIM